HSRCARNSFVRRPSAGPPPLIPFPKCPPPKTPPSPPAVEWRRRTGLKAPTRPFYTAQDGSRHPLDFQDARDGALDRAAQRKPVNPRDPATLETFVTPTPFS